MAVRQITERVHYVGAIDWDRRLFDALIPLPDGTSYNSYLVRGSDATVLIDAVDPAKIDVLQQHLTDLGVQRLDYLVANHAEQDHSGGIPYILERYPTAKVLCTPKCEELLVRLLHISADRIQTVADGETLSLGDRTLEFLHAPWVHWPETMMTYLKEDRILFSCDLFGSHLATSDLYAHDRARVAQAGRRYYGEIMMPFARQITKYLERLGGYDVDVIAPSHGPLHDDPAFVLDMYRDWTSPQPKNQATVAYISMHDSTKLLTERLVDRLTVAGVAVERFDLVDVDLGHLAASLIDSATVLVGSPTVLAGPHPHAVYATSLVNALRPKTMFLGVYGSYGWGTRMDQQLAGLCSNIRVEVLDPVLIKGKPTDEDYAAIDALAALVAEKHKAAGLQNR